MKAYLADDDNEGAAKRKEDKKEGARTRRTKRSIGHSICARYGGGVAMGDS